MFQYGPPVTMYMMPQPNQVKRAVTFNRRVVLVIPCALLAGIYAGVIRDLVWLLARHRKVVCSFGASKV